MEREYKFKEKELSAIVVLIKKLDVIIEEATFEKVEGTALKELMKIFHEKETIERMIAEKVKNYETDVTQAKKNKTSRKVSKAKQIPQKSSVGKAK